MNDSGRVRLTEAERRRLLAEKQELETLLAKLKAGMAGAPEPRASDILEVWLGYAESWQLTTSDLELDEGPWAHLDSLDEADPGEREP